MAIEILIKIKPIPFLNDNLRNCYGIFPEYSTKAENEWPQVLAELSIVSFVLCNSQSDNIMGRRDLSFYDLT